MAKYLRPTQPDTLAAMLRRLERIEKDLSKSLVIQPGVGIHIPGQLTVGGGADAGGGGGVAAITSGTPDVPTGFGSAASADDVNVWLDLSWTYPDASVARVTSFEIRWKRTADASTEYQYVVTQSSTVFRINGLVALTGYDLGIRSTSQLGAQSAWVTTTDTTVADSTAPAQVTGVVVATGNKTQMGTWTGNTETDLDHYLINVATSNSVNGSGKLDTGLVVDGEISAATVVTIDGLDGTGDTYYWQVAAVDASGNQGTYSATASNTTVLIESAWISTLVASKITTGTMTAQTITLSNSASSSIESATFSAGSAGWQILGDGNAEFNEITVRGALEAATIDIGGSDATSWHVDIDGNMWWGLAGSYAAATIKISSAGSVDLTTGTFSGALSAASGTFDGDISGANGTFTGDLSGSTITGGAIDIGGTDTTSWHVDSSGNMWWGNAGSYAAATIKISSAGSVDLTTGTFSGALSAATGSFAGSLTAATGTFSGSISAASGTFTGDLSGSAISGGTIAIGTNAFEVNSSGQLFMGGTTFANSPFSVDTDGAMKATDGTFSGAITGSSSTFGDAEGGFTISTGRITFTDAGVAKGKLDINSAYTNGILLTTHDGTGTTTGKTQLGLGATDAWFTSGTAGDTYVGSIDASGGTCGTVNIDAVTEIRLDCALTSFQEGNNVDIVTIAEASALTNVGLIKLWTGDTNAMGQIVWEAAGGSYTGDIQMDRYQNDFRIVRGAGVDMTIDASGNAYNRGGTWGTISDPSIKRNIRAATDRHSQLLALDVVDYELADRPGTHRGLDAAAAQLVFPELVETTFADPSHPEGLLSVKTSQIIWELLIYAQEMETRVSALEA